MKHRKYLLNVFLAATVFFTNSCSGAASAVNALSSKIILTGSTPGDSTIKSLLAISPESRVDFVRWDLTLNETKNGSKTYVLNINFGEGQPNTNGFKGGGEKLTFKGAFIVRKSQKADVYELKNDRAQTKISLVKLNDNLFHLLTPDNKLMIGNGGWSYTLSRKDSLGNDSLALPAWTTFLPDDDSSEIIFDGRTPCFEFAGQYNLQVGNDCHKLKWKLTLFRDSKTGKPTTFALQSTLNRPNTIQGKWTIVKGIKTNPEAIIYQLNPDKPDQSISFLVGDENVIFFLDREFRLFTGNGDFSFTLNRRKQ